MNIDPLIVLATFAVIFPAELPDKSMFASVVLSTRFKPLPVFLGLAAAFLVHGIIAVTAGSIINLLPHKVVASVVTLFFLVGAVYFLFTNEDEEQKEGEAEGAEGGNEPRSDARVMATAFGIIFVSEWGDLTQIAAINLTARYGEPLSVLIGTVAALWLVCGLGVLLGQRLVKSVPLALVRKIAGCVLLALAIWSFVDLIRS